MQHPTASYLGVHTSETKENDGDMLKNTIVLANII